MQMRVPATAALVLGVLPLIHCGSSSSSTAAPSATSAATPGTATSSTPSAGTTTLPAMYSKFGNGTQISLSGTTVVITTKDLPDHKSPYWGAGNALYEAPQPGMSVNPNVITAQNITFRIPASPVKATASSTPLGPMGVATNGVALFNQYAAGFQPLGPEIQSFDRYNGHPTGSNQYHYHVEPLWLTASSKGVLIGVLLDGFPVYGPQDSNGSTPSDLDSCNGHTGVTPDFPNGIYHYHITSAPPYIAGCFAGATGTVTGG
jgi:hypothetical protein